MEDEKHMREAHEQGSRIDAPKKKDIVVIGKGFLTTLPSSGVHCPKTTLECFRRIGLVHNEIFEAGDRLEVEEDDYHYKFSNSPTFLPSYLPYQGSLLDVAGTSTGGTSLPELQHTMISSAKELTINNGQFMQVLGDVHLYANSLLDANGSAFSTFTPIQGRSFYREACLGTPTSGAEIQTSGNYVVHGDLHSFHRQHWKF
ncbi:hypothetical protein BDN70DRAFT_898823 [Pholiota conissans]|uniref:Uncharacterized protein n=1 Tax=Pholiota conissans TaxID=109636 RepID=A0A9P5YTU4_9AGAR|nr:hypothetical protein BDN70DRAFT_898823 [Pholiota conissans]